MKILLTGATGFLGRNIRDHFSKYLPDDELIGVGSSVYDLRSSNACRKLLNRFNPNVVIHAAGSVGGIGANRENPGKFMYDNLAMGMNMIEESRLYKVDKFVLLGTVCSYPKHTPVPFYEEYLWDGYPEETNAPYGIAKKTLMKLAETYHQQYGMNVVNLIPVNMYGPYDHFNLTSSHVIPALILKFFNAVKSRERDVYLWGTGNASREFLYAPDCVEAITLAVKNDIGPEPVNIGNGEEVLIKDLANKIAEQIGWEGNIHFDHKNPDGQPRRCLNTNRAKSRLGFEAKTYWEDGLKRTIGWFLSNVQKLNLDQEGKI